MMNKPSARLISLGHSRCISVQVWRMHFTISDVWIHSWRTELPTSNLVNISFLKSFVFFWVNANFFYTFFKNIYLEFVHLHLKFKFIFQNFLSQPVVFILDMLLTLFSCTSVQYRRSSQLMVNLQERKPRKIRQVIMSAFLKKKCLFMSNQQTWIGNWCLKYWSFHFLQEYLFVPLKSIPRYIM